MGNQQRERKEKNGNRFMDRQTNVETRDGKTSECVVSRCSDNDDISSFQLNSLQVLNFIIRTNKLYSNAYNEFCANRYESIRLLSNCLQ